MANAILAKSGAPDEPIKVLNGAFEVSASDTAARTDSITITGIKKWLYFDCDFRATNYWTGSGNLAFTYSTEATTTYRETNQQFGAEYYNTSGTANYWYVTDISKKWDGELNSLTITCKHNNTWNNNTWSTYSVNYTILYI